MLRNSAVQNNIRKELFQIEETIKKRKTHKTFGKSIQNYQSELYPSKQMRDSHTPSQKKSKHPQQESLRQNREQCTGNQSHQFTLTQSESVFRILQSELEHRNKIYAIAEPYLSSAQDPALQLEKIFRYSYTLNKIVGELRKNIGKESSSLEEMREWIGLQKSNYDH